MFRDQKLPFLVLPGSSENAILLVLIHTAVGRGRSVGRLVGR